MPKSLKFLTAFQLEVKFLRQLKKQKVNMPFNFLLFALCF